MLFLNADEMISDLEKCADETTAAGVAVSDIS